MNIGGRILWSQLKIPGVTVSVKRAPKPHVCIYRVKQMVDMGAQGRMAMVEPFDTNDGFELIMMDEQVQQKSKLSVPHKIGNLRFIYAASKKAVLTDLDYVLNCVLHKKQVDKVVLEVLSPGDLMVVRPKKQGGIHSVEVLRIAGNMQKENNGHVNAL